jgi:pyruvate/2-oxoglutarate dehydrogenase complex dihydrolipoamide acyltransferase (E2) component
MAHTVVMPEIGQTIDEATVDEWMVNIGDEVEKGEPILTVECDKAMIEVVASTSGRLTRQLVEVGQTIRSGEPVAEIE